MRSDLRRTEPPRPLRHLGGRPAVVIALSESARHCGGPGEAVAAGTVACQGGRVTLRRAAAVLCCGASVLTLAGCAGAPGVQPDTRPTVRIAEAARPADVVPLGRYLPDDRTLAAAVGTAPGGLLGRPVEGGPDVLLRTVSDTDVTPATCLGPAYPVQGAAYGATPVRSVATNSWAGGGFDGPPVTASFGVVQLDSPAAAQEEFAALSEQWRRCNGQTVTRRDAASAAADLVRIGDVAFDMAPQGGVVTASVLHASAGAGSPPALRAVALSGDCLTDVEVIDPRPGRTADAAVGVADAIVAALAARR